jgi:hypothetical protein
VASTSHVSAAPEQQQQQHMTTEQKCQEGAERGSSFLLAAAELLLVSSSELAEELSLTADCIVSELNKEASQEAFHGRRNEVLTKPNMSVGET